MHFIALQVKEAIQEELSEGTSKPGVRHRSAGSSSKGTSTARYSRLEAEIGSMQRDSATYCDEPQASSCVSPTFYRLPAALLLETIISALPECCGEFCWQQITPALLQLRGQRTANLSQVSVCASTCHVCLLYASSGHGPQSIGEMPSQSAAYSCPASTWQAVG